MTWWGWLILASYIYVMFYVARKTANKYVLAQASEYKPANREDHLLGVTLGLGMGLIWPCLFIWFLLVTVFYPKIAREMVEHLIPRFMTRDDSESERTDDEVRKEVDRLRREYTMPKWKRFILRMIRV